MATRSGMELCGFAKGARFSGPDGMGYELTRQILRGDVIPVGASDFIAYGGAPEPVEGEQMPSWLSEQLHEVFG